MGRLTDKQVDREVGIYTVKQVDRYVSRQAGRQVDICVSRQPGRQVGRQSKTGKETVHEAYNWRVHRKLSKIQLKRT